jgi:hypothetical protein
VKNKNEAPATESGNMIKTLRITTIVAAALAAVLFVLVVVFGFRSNGKADKFLSMPSVIEKFKKAAGERLTKNTGQISPLVKQAKLFAFYLDPPPALKPNKTIKPTPHKPTPIPKPEVVSAKFTLAGTAYYEANPSQSWALINEIGKGLHWVKQQGKVGHLIIQEVKNGLVVVKDGQRTFELAPQRTPKKSLVKNSSSDSSGTKPVSVLPGRTSTITSTPPRTSTITPTARKDTITSTALKASTVKPRDIEISQAELAEQEARAQKILAELEAAMKISSQEAEKLDNLGKQLNAQRDPNRDKISKIRSSRRPIVPRRTVLPKRPPR